MPSKFRFVLESFQTVVADSSRLIGNLVADCFLCKKVCFVVVRVIASKSYDDN